MPYKSSLTLIILLTYFLYQVCLLLETQKSVIDFDFFRKYLKPLFSLQIESHLLEQKEVICTSDKIIVNLAFIEPFNGMVFVEEKFADDKCRWPGTGGHYLLVVMPLENATTTAATGLYNNNGFCGLKYDPQRAEHSLTLVISPDPVVITDETFALNVKCIYSTRDLLLTLAAPSMDPIKLT